MCSNTERPRKVKAANALELSFTKQILFSDLAARCLTCRISLIQPIAWFKFLDNLVTHIAGEDIFLYYAWVNQNKIRGVDLQGVQERCFRSFIYPGKNPGGYQAEQVNNFHFGEIAKITNLAGGQTLLFRCVLV